MALPPTGPPPDAKPDPISSSTKDSKPKGEGPHIPVSLPGSPAPDLLPVGMQHSVSKTFKRRPLTINIPEQSDAFLPIISNQAKIVLPGSAVLSRSAASIARWSPEELRVTPWLSDRSGWLGELLKTVNALVEENVPINFKTRLLPRSTHASGEGGISGSYFFYNVQGEKIAVFKPEDEELGMINCPNPSRRSPQDGGARDGIVPGLSATLECVAYLLGKESGVPPTVKVTLPCFSTFGCYADVRTKVGSFQRFVPNPVPFQAVPRDTFMAMGPQFITQMQTIALLDIKLFNTDRNRKNLLFANGQLVPIDHGCIAASGFLDDINVCWLDLADVVDVPINKELIRRLNLDWERDQALIKTHFPNFPQENLQTLEASHALLEVGLKHGLTIKQMVSFLLPAPKGLAETSLERCVMYYLFNKAKATGNFSVAIRQLIEETIAAIPSKETAAPDPNDRTYPALRVIRSELFWKDGSPPAAKL